MTDVAIRRNPYIIGRPISEPELFFGRERLFQFVADSLQKRERAILLHGQRRIGKSSVLAQIPLQVPRYLGEDSFVFVYFDLHDKSRLPLGRALHGLAKAIIKQLGLDAEKVALPTEAELEANCDLFAEIFLPLVFDELAERSLVLLLDEFDVLHDRDPSAAAEHLFPYLKSLIEERDRLYIIPVIGRQLDDLPNFLTLFRNIPRQEIGLLEEKSARRLIVEPVRGTLNYDEEAVRAILRLSSGHPYFTQVICNALFVEAQLDESWNVERQDVELIIDKAIESAEGGLAWFQDGLPSLERVVFLAIAEAQGKGGAALTSNEEPLEFLCKHGVGNIKQLRKARARLVEWGFLEEQQDSNLLLGISIFKVKIELASRWIVKRHSLSKAIANNFQPTSPSNKPIALARHLLLSKAIASDLKFIYLPKKLIARVVPFATLVAIVCIDFAIAPYSVVVPRIFALKLSGTNSCSRLCLLVGVDIRKANLDNANLSKSDLRRANLSQANLSEANLRQANLAEANLAGANLAEANLAGANLAGANLVGANLAGVNLAGVNLAGVNLAGVNLAGADLAGVSLAGVNLVETNLAGANLSKVSLVNANLERAELIDVNLKGANLFGANLTRANLTRANLSEADFTGANLEAAILEKSNLSQADLEEANLANTNLREANLQGSQLARTNVVGADFTNANFSNSNVGF